MTQPIKLKYEDGISKLDNLRVLDGLRSALKTGTAKYAALVPSGGTAVIHNSWPDVDPSNVVIWRTSYGTPVIQIDDGITLGIKSAKKRSGVVPTAARFMGSNVSRNLARGGGRMLARFVPLLSTLSLLHDISAAAKFFRDNGAGKLQHNLRKRPQGPSDDLNAEDFYTFWSESNNPTYHDDFRHDIYVPDLSKTGNSRGEENNDQVIIRRAHNTLDKISAGKPPDVNHVNFFLEWIEDEFSALGIDMSSEFNLFAPSLQYLIDDDMENQSITQANLDAIATFASILSMLIDELEQLDCVKICSFPALTIDSIPDLVCSSDSSADDGSSGSESQPLVVNVGYSLDFDVEGRGFL